MLFWNDTRTCMLLKQRFFTAKLCMWVSLSHDQSLKRTDVKHLAYHNHYIVAERIAIICFCYLSWTAVSFWRLYKASHDDKSYVMTSVLFSHIFSRKTFNVVDRIVVHHPLEIPWWLWHLIRGFVPDFSGFCSVSVKCGNACLFDHIKHYFPCVEYSVYTLAYILDVCFVFV